MDEINKEFIVPIFAIKNDEYFFKGTGFIVGDKLFSAAHVFIDAEKNIKYSFKFKDNYIQLSEPDFREYYVDNNLEGTYKGEEIHKDLIFFSIDKFDSPYVFFNEEYTWEEKLFFCGFSEKEISKRVSTDECIVSIREEAHYYPKTFPEDKKVLLTNCMQLQLVTAEDTFNYPLTEGNSGCPIMDNQHRIYGLFLGYTELHENKQYKAITSKYILNRSKPVAKITFSTSGFFRDPSYSFYVGDVIKDYKDKFGEAEEIKVNLEEVHLERDREPFKFSDDGKKVEINFYQQIYLNKKGRPNPLPAPHSVFEMLRYVMDRAIDEYNDKFSKPT